MATRAADTGIGEVPGDDLEIELAPMRRRHLRRVLEIEAAVYPRPWSFSLFLSELALRGSRAYVIARCGDELVGYAGLMMALDDAHVTTIAVDPAWHRRHIATRLLLHLADVARERGAAHMTLEVRVGNTEAQNLYRAFGFRPAGIRRGYYAETNEDALVMWADDIGGAPYAVRLAEIAHRVRGRTKVVSR
ncbi:MAG: ribosomal protein S18-alanine N-acetyltransferase [Actinobacteria bacterium]|nr:ribosomal protein S18-alanine N-acetyltransferase [Actinomycetota bacterium]